LLPSIHEGQGFVFSFANFSLSVSDKPNATRAVLPCFHALFTAFMYSCDFSSFASFC
jgi:hypothetical protein